MCSEEILLRCILENDIMELGAVLCTVRKTTSVFHSAMMETAVCPCH